MVHPFTVGINHGKLKNRLGAYHAPLMTFLDFNMLKTLPEGQVRNGFAELMKISSCADKRIWDLLVGHGEELINTRFGRLPGADPELKKIADEICWRGIKVMLDVRPFSDFEFEFVIIDSYTVARKPELT